MKRFVVPLLLACLSLAGCAGNFGAYYRGMSSDDIKKDPAMIACEKPEVRQLPDEPEDKIINDMYARGYAVIGRSDWQGLGNDGDSEALAQAESLGACLVLWSAPYAHTESGTRREETVIPGRTYTTREKVTVKTSRGKETAWIKREVREPDTIVVEYVPYSDDYYNYQGIFFVRFKPGFFGIKSKKPDPELLRRLNAPSGAQVEAILEGGGADKMGLRPGDVILSVNDVPCQYDRHIESCNAHGGNTIRIYRDGAVLVKDFFMPAPGM